MTQPPFSHPTATVDEGAELGPGTKIWHYSHISSGARIGAGCSFGQNSFVASGVVVGDGVRVQNNVSLYDGVVIEDDVFLGPSCVLTSVINPRSHVSRKDEYRATRLRRGCSIGANATVVCGSEVGRYAFVGAGAGSNSFATSAPGAVSGSTGGVASPAAGTSGVSMTWFSAGYSAPSSGADCLLDLLVAIGTC